MFVASEEATSGSVMQNAERISPSSSGRSQRSCCSAVPNIASTSMLPVSGAEQFIASGASCGLCPLISASGAYCRLLRPAPSGECGKNRFHSPQLAPEAMNCSAPDTGNMEVLAMFGTAEQQDRWLRPLLEGEIRSAFCMTEPDVASSDATNIDTRIGRAGDDYVINGRKWWSSGAMNPRCQIMIVMGKTDPGGERHRQQSMVLVPRVTPGVTVRRGMTVYGYRDESHGGHAEVEFADQV